MPVKMAAHQLAFWRELLAPFAPHELSEVPARGGKKTLTYLDKRALENRLDSVCGPNGWYPEYESTARGYKCRLYILCPSASHEGTWVWHHKEDGAGFEEMGSYNKQTNEWEADVDNDEKSGYTNALRRAAQDAWGIGRYLYSKGIPSFLDPNAQAPEAPCAAAPTHAPAASPSAPPAELADPAPAANYGGRDTAATAPAARTQQQGQQYDNFKIPPPGKAVFKWAKEMEKEFQTKVVDGMANEGEKRGVGKVFADWTGDSVRDICMGAIEFLRSLPTYKGQFDHLFQQGTAPAQDAAPAPQSAVLAELRRELINSITALVERQTGMKPGTPALRLAYQNISAECANAKGHRGEVSASLAENTDPEWIMNMIVFVKAQIAQTVKQGDQSQSDCPF